MDITQVAKEIRTILKANFPGIKFSVKSSRFSMGESVDVTWTDGPTRRQVDELIGKCGDTRYRFIKTSRKHSIEFADKTIKVWKEQNPKYAHFVITSQGKIDCYGIEIGDEFNAKNDILQDCKDSIYKFLRNSTLDSLTLATPPQNTDCEPEAVSAPEPEFVKIATETAPQSQPNQLDLVESDTIAPVKTISEVKVDPGSEMYRHGYDNAAICFGYVPDISDKQDAIDYSAGLSAGYASRDAIRAHNSKNQQNTQPQQNQLDQTESDVFKVDRQQAYTQYLASQQEADALEAKLAVKKTEAQVYFAIMKEIDEKIQAKKREAEVVTTPQTQPDFDVRTLESKKVTLILINTMGFPVCRHITVIAADIVSAKRYHGEMTDKKCLELQCIEKGKRKPRGTRYTEADLAVALGWQDIKVPTDNGYINAFDNGLFDAMVHQARDVVYTQQGL